MVVKKYNNIHQKKCERRPHAAECRYIFNIVRAQEVGLLYMFQIYKQYQSINQSINSFISDDKVHFGWSSIPDHAGKAYSAPQTLWLNLRDLLL